MLEGEGKQYSALANKGLKDSQGYVVCGCGEYEGGWGPPHFL